MAWRRAAAGAAQRPASARAAALVVTAMVIAAMVAMPAAAAELSAQQRAGKRLYFEGIGASGEPVVAFVGAEGSRVPGRVVPCASCHGGDGQGRRESAVQAPAVVWSELTKPYGHRHDNGRQHGSFDEASVVRAVSDGIDPAGQPLDRVMPRFALGRDDAANLVAYLKQLEFDVDAGLHGERLRIGTVVPAAGPLLEAGRVARRVLQAYVDDLNAAGGVHGRRIELVVGECAGAPGGWAACARALAAQDIFALVAPVVGPAEAEIVAWVEQERVPLVGPLGASGAGPLQRFTFHLLAGPRELARALAAYGVAELGLKSATALVAVSDDAAHTGLRDALAEQCRKLACARVHDWVYAPASFDARAVLQAMRTAGAKVLFFLGPDADLAALLRTADAQGEHPIVLLPGTLGARVAAQAPERFDGRLLLAFPTMPNDMAAPGSAFEAFRNRHRLGPALAGTQASAYAAAALLAEGLRQSGRTTSREKLVAALDAVRGLKTDALPVLSYGPGRRVGALGAYVFALDASRRGFKVMGPWLRLD